MRSVEELKRVHPKEFPSNLSEQEQIEWLRIATPKALEIAKRGCTTFHGPTVHARVVAEIDRKAAEAHRVESLAALQATVPPPPEPKKPWYRDGTNVKWAVGLIVTIAGILLKIFLG